MTELNENGDSLYIGGYIDNRKKQYPRNGEGKEYHECKLFRFFLFIIIII